MEQLEDFQPSVLGAGGFSMPEDVDTQGLEKDSAGEEQRMSPKEALVSWIPVTNIASLIEDEEQLKIIGQDVLRGYQIDLKSREEWLDQAEEGMKMAMQIAEKKNTPWPGASAIVYPLMTVAANQFAARAYPSIIKGKDVVKGVVTPDAEKGIPELASDGQPAVEYDPMTGQPVLGQDGQPQIKWKVAPGEVKQRADRIGAHMSCQLLDENDYWEEDTDKLLHILPIVGCHFRKTYYSDALHMNMSSGVHAKSLVINYWAKSLETAPRITEELEYYPLEIIENYRAGVFLLEKYGVSEVDGKPQDTSDKNAPVAFLEQHTYIDLDGDGYPEPYIVTVHKSTGQVARIVARYDEDGIFTVGNNGKIIRIKPVHYYTKYDFLPNPEGGIYGIGLGKLLMPVNAAVNTTLNMMIDAGHLQNTGGGFIGKGLSMHTGAVRFKPGEFKPVNAPGSTIRDSVVTFDFKGPSPVLFQLLGMLIEAGRDIASIKDVLSGETTAPSMDPSTLMALIEQGLQVFTAIYKRIHRSLKQEYAKLYRLNRIYLPEITSYTRGDIAYTIKREDYEKASGVIPVSDPSMVTDMQKLARSQFLMQFINDPMMDGAEVRRRVLDAANIENIDTLFAKEQRPDPLMLVKAQEFELEDRKLKIKEKEVSISEVKEMAMAVRYLALADKDSADQDIAWADRHLNILKAQVDRLNQEQRYEVEMQKQQASQGGLGG